VALREDRGDGRQADRGRDVDRAPRARQEKGSLALEATGAISDDGIIDPRDTRTVLGICLSVVRNKPIEGARGYGVFRL
jgi:acetyl-CoA carboxylase carboxyltransferase component